MMRDEGSTVNRGEETDIVCYANGYNIYIILR